MSNPDKPSHAKGILALSVLCGATLQSQSAEAAIYTYVDQDGTRWLTNAPKQGNKYKLVAKYGAPQKNAPKPKARVTASYNPTPGIYSTNTGYVASSFAAPAAGIPARHCGGQTHAQLERKLDPHLDSLRAFSRSYGVEENLIRAVMKQESCFNASALSRAGAIGLMQLMPTTASHVAKKTGDSYSGRQQLIDPDMNIRLGSAYLKELLDNYNGNRVLAAAAYNAGPGRVRQWRRASAGRDMDIWVENIPYRETRNYVQNVLVFNAIYQHQLRSHNSFLTERERTMRY